MAPGVLVHTVYRVPLKVLITGLLRVLECAPIVWRSGLHYHPIPASPLLHCGHHARLEACPIVLLSRKVIALHDHHACARPLHARIADRQYVHVHASTST